MVRRAFVHYGQNAGSFATKPDALGLSSDNQLATHNQLHVMRLGSIRILVCLTVLLLIVPASYSQLVRPRVGVGMGVVGSTGANPFGLGLDTRLAFPINADLSISAGASFVNYVFQGRDGAAYFISPSISLIVTMNTEAPRSPYLVAGLGAYLPLAGDTEKNESGPIVEAGIGWVFGLQQTSVYLEITPALVVARSAVDMQIPVRVGIIL